MGHKETSSVHLQTFKRSQRFLCCPVDVVKVNVIRMK
jgi:hypothetical protein